MKKPILFLAVLSVMLSSTACGSGIKKPEAVTLPEGYYILTDYYTEKSYGDAIAVKNVNNGKIAFYGYDGKLISGPFDGYEGGFFKNGHNFYVLSGWENYYPGDEVYENYFENPTDAEKGKQYKKIPGGLARENYYIVDDNGKSLLPDNKPWDVEVLTKGYLNSCDVFVRPYDGKDFCLFSREKLVPTDWVMFASRLKAEKSNVYDTVTRKYLFEDIYDEVGYSYRNGRFFFFLYKDGKVSIKTAEDSKNELIIKTFDEKLYTDYEIKAFNTQILPGKKEQLDILILNDGNEKSYINMASLKPIGKEAYEAICSHNDKAQLKYFSAELPYGIRAEYSEDGGSVAVYSNEREIIKESGYGIALMDGYYLVCMAKNSPVKIYDVEGNKIFEGGSGYNFHLKDNCIYILDIFNENGIEINPIFIENPAPKIYINGEFMLTDTLPRIKNGRTLVPLRAFAEMMEFQVKEPDEKGRIEISKDGKTVAFTLGSLEGEKDGEKFKLEAAPEIINNRTLVPVRALAEAFECEVLWNGETTEVVIKN